MKREKDWVLSESEKKPDGSMIYTITKEKTQLSFNSAEGYKNETMALLNVYLSGLKELR